MRPWVSTSQKPKISQEPPGEIFRLLKDHCRFGVDWQRYRDDSYI